MAIQPGERVTSGDDKNRKPEEINAAMAAWARQNPKEFKRLRESVEASHAPEKKKPWKAVIAGSTAVAAAIGIGYGVFGRGDTKSGSPSALTTSHSAPAIPGNAGETTQKSTAETKKLADKDQTVFPGFTLSPDADPASGVESISGEEALADALEYSHPPFGVEDQNLINATIATDVFKRLGYILGASGQLTLDDNGTPSSRLTEKRNDKLSDVAADVLFTKSGKNSPFGKAFFGYIDQNTNRIEEGRSDTLGYSDLAAAAQINYGELVRSGNANMPVQTSILHVGLPNGERYKLEITGRPDDNGDFIWRISNGQKLPGAQ